MSRFFNRFCQLLGIRLSPASARHPQTNGLCERANRSICEVLRTTLTAQSNWLYHLPLIEIALNTGVQRATRCSAYELELGREVYFSLPTALKGDDGALKLWSEALHEARENIKAAQQKQKVYADQHRRKVEFQPGDRVLVNARRLPGWHKLQQPWIGPFVVQRRKGELAYELDLPEHWKIGRVFHVEYM
eukprot:Blabericola_migrator_1__744@NODE_1185_length_5188_cov_32_591681_g806_i0_p4_GENE_NODE_1185_length_5188_cov_32_591681_g806_i0NODE_1185_length_5188_cov_32_591681_g806_i0_p4_ORF_typecomplete_len190_score16_03rve/PF00665_26/3e08rve/PF00665_26/6_8e03MLVIN_C/PF18697_1/7_8e03MLVIN_C/PF18697_1/1_7e03MLVIN_C/PF18697_1/0_0061rve_3/PF13683_6/0_025rve_3/PF13683_6/7_3e03_NODE_1185_length_5188_cov_32_591681_g806_i035894158